ncbi:1,4-dihydroxy-2-naphthoate octaprenyltransferase [Alisedimentitalea sp. MJ-SS2]|uniref:1,4-dihydroxy-2-naphthoate octaprenyltransferase n=1 Tax=Aliisedimentitalea sp. MJ-SS2 TaxID=3049795 RepID=UPI002913D354|nr:1,4-dihydroxy-2-naphthoate octaprenyltransferase [Alisedimentitalea sp. MJ-SS2]MDU8928520.1 1,4-dihydroxy-2-naphthoate octaprenyltransferase [Alisedimentitalea sp. MJ-SS2]
MTTQAAMVAQLEALPKPLLWVIAARVKTLGLSLAPVGAGSWLAAHMGHWRVDVMLAAMGAAAAIQIGTNLWNDAADAKSGVDGPERLGPPRLTSLGLLDGGQVRRAAAGTFVIAVLLGLYLTALGGWPIVAIGLVSLALGFFYSMGPRPLSGTALGELLVIAFFGVVAVAGTVYLQGHAVGGAALVLGTITGLPAAAVLLLNNHRDRVSDARAGRRTLAILLGQGASKGLYGLFLLAAWIGAIAFAGGVAMALLPAAALGIALCLAIVRLDISPALNRLIPGTAAFQVLLLLGIAGGAL